MRDGDTIALREVLVHMIEEYARHCGRADLLRERIDGRVGQVPVGCHWPNTAVAMATPKTPPVFWNVEPTPLARLAAVAES